MKKAAYMLILALITCIGLTKGLQPQREAEADEAEAAAQARAEGHDVVRAPHGESTRTPNSTTSSTLPEGMALPRYESSRGGQLIERTGYTLSYDADFKTPQWVAWTLTADEAEGSVPRESNFTADPDVRGAKAYPADYTNSGYDRGHMAPAGDMKWSEEAMRESFYMTNICPQNRNLNRGDWKDLEEKERDWALARGAVSIAAGPIYSTKRPKRIGNHQVAVPDAFFKVILVDYPKAPKAYGFIFRNEAGSRPLQSYQLSVNEVERRTGIDFFPGLSEEVEDQVPELF